VSTTVILKAIDVSLSYGSKAILDGVGLEVREGEIAALVGPNGSGKSSLLRILAGLQSPDSGKVLVFRRGLPVKDLRLGYLSQQAGENEPSGDETLLDSVLAGFSELPALERRIREISGALDARPDDDELLRRLGELHECFEAAGGYDVQAAVEASLRRVGFDEGDLDRPLAEFSGGWKTRARLAGLLARAPELLLLDEPTNHLDLESMEWLEEFLLDYDRPVLVVSHDRYHLDRVADRVFEIKQAHLHEYTGNYTAYVRQAEARARDHRRRWEKEERERQRLEKAADRQMRWAEEAHAAAGINDHARRLAKKAYKRSLATARRLERRIEGGVEKPWEDDRIRISLSEPGKTGGPVLVLKDAAAGYGGRPVLSDLHLWVRPGDRLIVVGPNGSGKTTFLRLLAGEPVLLGGKMHTPPGLRVGYFRQELENLEPEAVPFDLAARAGEEGRWSDGLSRSEIRTYLGTFLFRGDDVFRPVARLSIGEKVRLSLACLLLKEPDLLLLDEPTNHLDIPAREAVEEALARFGGTVVLVSHDRYLLDRAATRVLDLGRPGRPVVWPGNYSYYLAKKRETAGGAEGEGPRRS